MTFAALITGLIEAAGALGRLVSDAEVERTAERERVASYCLAVADTLQRAAETLERSGETGAARRSARTAAARELGRLTGYCEDLAEVLAPYLDVVKIAGLKRRIARLRAVKLPSDRQLGANSNVAHLARLLEAEGYMRSIADRLRAG